MKNKITLMMHRIVNHFRRLLFGYDYSYVIFDNYNPLEKRLVPVNIKFDKSTKLCKIMTRTGSDKAGFIGKGQHNYTPLYHLLFKKLRNQEFNFFELGIGTTNLNLDSNMGENGTPGGSLLGWREYFLKAKIFAADIDRDILFDRDGIKCYYCDQTNPNDIRALWEDIKNIKFKVIIDDGLHTFAANQTFLEHSLVKLDSYGVYIVEDVIFDQLDIWKEYLKSLSNKSADLRFSIITIPNKLNSYDNNLIIIHFIKRK